MKLVKLVVPVLALVLIAVAVGLYLHNKAQHQIKAAVVTDSNAIRYLPLGDSYTIGQSVTEDQRWPNQLVDTYAKAGTKIQIVDNPSVTGYTTQNLIDTELPLVPKLKPDFVTILIGVNDYVQGVDSSTFENNLSYIIKTLQSELSQPGNILLVTIPDFAKTPTGASFGDPATSTAGIEAFNAIIATTAQHYNLPVADIFTTSQAVATNQALIANDGLHPSGQETQPGHR